MLRGGDGSDLIRGSEGAVVIRGGRKGGLGHAISFDDRSAIQQLQSHSPRGWQWGGG